MFNKRPDECRHPKVMPKFDREKAQGMSTTEVRAAFPRFSGTCPDCGYYGALYASMTHYIYGDW